MPKYIIKDGYNGDVVYRGDDIEDALAEYWEYEEGCEGDWIPVIKGSDALELARRVG